MEHENPRMGPHDVGGEESGPIDVVDHGMSHWEKHANALRMTVSGLKLATVDEMRRAAENLGDRYNQIGYFEKQTEANRTQTYEYGRGIEVGDGWSTLNPYAHQLGDEVVG